MAIHIQRHHRSIQSTHACRYTLFYKEIVLVQGSQGKRLTLEKKTDGPPRPPISLDQSLNDAAAEKIRKYRADYNNRPPSAVSFMLTIPSTSGRLHSEFVRLLFLQLIGKLTAFLQLQEFNLRRVGNILAKVAALRINLNLDGEPIASKSHTHPSHSQTSRLLTSSLSVFHYGTPTLIYRFYL
jgi:hypothetical protein